MQLVILTPEGHVPSQWSEHVAQLVRLGVEVRTPPMAEHDRRSTSPFPWFGRRHDRDSRLPAAVADSIAEDAAVIVAGLPARMVAALGSATTARIIPAAEAVPALLDLRRRAELDVVRTVDESVRRGDIEDVLQLSDRASTDALGPGTVPTLAASAATARLNRTGTAATDLGSTVAAALGAADSAWARGEIPEAVYAFAAALRLLFDPELHADAAAFPLALDPRGFLAPLEHSAMYRDLLTTSDSSRRPRVAGDRHRVVVLTGAYPRFAAPLLQVLREAGADVVEEDLGRRYPLLRWLGPNTRAVALRVAAHPAGRNAARIVGTMPDPAVLEGAGTVVAEWGDRGTMWASLTVPLSTRLVVRLHGMDLFSPWVQLTDWAAVDDLIVVSEPFESLARSILGDRLDGVRVHVIEHAPPSDRFHPAAAPEETLPRTLGMIGWGKIVKDPAWTLDVLELLVEHDPRWRLMLVGEPLPPGRSDRQVAYADRVDRQLSGALGQHVIQVPQTSDVVPFAQQLGFVVSSSRRESFHLGLLEGVLCGAVPIVRDWPVYGGRLADGGLYPSAWVTGADPATAAARIAALRDPADRASAAATARRIAQHRFEPQRFSRQIRSVILN